MIRAFHFVGATLRDGSSIPKDGAWLEVMPPLTMCEHGLHWSRHPFDALTYAPGNTLCLIDADGDVIEEDDKGCSTHRRIVARIDAEPMLFEFSRWAALQVAHLWNQPMPEVVRQWLETGNDDLRSAARSAAASAWSAAESAARSAAESAAWSAAWSTAESAAESAEKSKQRDMFLRAVETEFTAIGVTP